ncbi:MAG TPA: hypothetical protein VN493_15305 [Thermoanaerobaculia bacterium]|nr:hypothetical protein [Thermoanaerobaculia bacterium]
MRLPVRKLVLTTLYATALAVIVLYAWEGSSYYSTPLIERPRHEDYWTLKPGGSRGHALGIAGSSLMVVMLVYSVRKRTKALRGAGKLRDWLDFHIFCGVIGPLLVVLHSSFKVHGLVALSFWSMVVVALSGVLGRYLYLQIPRTRAGDQLSLAEVEELNADLTRRLREELGEAPLQELEALAAGSLKPGTPLLPLLLRMPVEGVRLRWRLRSFRRRYRRHGGSTELLRTIRQKALLQRRLLLWSRLQELFHHWHVLHKPFAVVMYVFMIVHIVVAVLTGYAWQ